MQKTSSQITIGIPFFNDSRYLGMAIRSVINQTYQDWVLLLVDDGSSDGSLEIAKSYAENDNRITVISDGQNRQLPYRLNQIASLTKTSYLARMDADDIMHPERVERQLGILQENPKIDVLGTNAFTIDANNSITGVRCNFSEELVSVSGFIHPSIMAKTKWFQENPYDEKAIRVEDGLLWEITKHKSVFKRTNQALLFYREVPGSYYKKYFNYSKSLMNIFISRRNLYKGSYLIKNSVKGFIKGCVYRFFGILNQEKYLIKKRNNGVLNSVEKIRAQDFIYFVLKDDN